MIPNAFALCNPTIPYQFASLRQSGTPLNCGRIPPLVGLLSLDLLSLGGVLNVEEAAGRHDTDEDDVAWRCRRKRHGHKWICSRLIAQGTTYQQQISLLR